MTTPTDHPSTHDWIRNEPSVYSDTPFDEATLPRNPLELFSTWFDLANQHSTTANIMHLATVNAHHAPNCRVVLLKSFDANGFVFFTNYHSVKADELNTQPYACANFLWVEDKHQVRIQGEVNKLDDRESDEYFASRPRESQLGAWVSDQSSVIPSRQYLEQRYETLDKQYHNKPIPRPPHWGGYLLIPDNIEFWQGGARRLHDRFLYQKLTARTWQISRLAP